MGNPTVSLVLGSGGARGLAHIGVIHWLEAHDFEVRTIAGSSMGALIGGIYAAGKLDAYTRWVSALERMDVVRLLDFSFGRDGLFKGERVIDKLKDLIGDCNIEDLPISFTAVATDVEAEKEVWLQQGSLFDAIRASIAIPTVFTPHLYHGRKLFDGGLMDPIPIAPTLTDQTDLTIAVSLSGKPEPRIQRPSREWVAEKKEQIDGVNYRQGILQFIDSLYRKQEKDEHRPMDLFDVIANTMDTMHNTIARFKLAAYTPDAVITIPRNVCTFHEFHRAPELIEIGWRYADNNLQSLIPSKD